MSESKQENPLSKLLAGLQDLSMEKRMLLALALMGGVLFLTPYFLPTPKPVKPPVKGEPAKTAAAKDMPAKGAEASATPPAAPVAIPGAVAGDKEAAHVIETDLYRIEFSNRGATVHSWLLRKYKDSDGKPLELANRKAVVTTGYPFALWFKDKKPQTDLNRALYRVRRTGTETAPGIEFEFSDGRTFSKKSFQFRKDQYLSKFSSELVDNGAPLAHWVAWRGGFGDATVASAASTQHTLHYDLTAAKLVVKAAGDAKDGPVGDRGTYSFAGIEDAYFAAVALPDAGASIEVQTLSDTVASEKEEKETPHVGAALGGDGRLAWSLFVGPRDIDLLRRVHPRLEQLVDFGWSRLLAKPLFLSLKWLSDGYIHNYGWSIITITVIINFLLLPLKFTSLKSMKKMQILQPQIAAINAEYKGLSLKDPRKAEQNQKIMDLYKKNGVNPMGGCVPMLLQIPFFIAFYSVLTVAIELRGAQWLWVTDLSRPEQLPIHILPLTMVATQFILQKMTPAAGDPAQQKVMLLMPLMFGFMFYSMSSGLVLYWLTGNIVGIAQQYFFNKTGQTVSPAPAPAPARKSKGPRK